MLWKIVGTSWLTMFGDFLDLSFISFHFAKALREKELN